MKVLVISGMPIRTDTNNGKTFKTLLAGFNPEELAQLYFSPQVPNVDVCSSYYQICESQILKSMFGLKSKACGGTVLPFVEGTNAERPKSNPRKLVKNKEKNCIKFARELIWDIAYWKNKSFKEWLSIEKPEVIFAIMHNTNGVTRAVKWVAERTACPVVLFVTDDFYNDQENSNNILRKRYYKIRRNLYQKMSQHIKLLVGCSEKASEYFADVLGVPSKVVYTPSAAIYLDMPYKKQEKNKIVYLRYFGNMGLGREDILRQIGLVLQRINEGGCKAILEVYSGNVDQQIIEKLTIKNGCIFKGWVYGEEYLSLLQSADIAVHVESFDEKMIRRTWVSISTKIADYLGAGKCILAIGPEEIASIAHIKEAACVVNQLDELHGKVELLVENSQQRDVLQKKARFLAKKEHDIEAIKRQMRQILEDSKK